MKGRIKTGTTFSHDMRVRTWPKKVHPTGNDHDQDMIFDLKWNGKFWVCSADGFGYGVPGEPAGKYGNGSIFVFDKDGVEIIEE